MSAGKLARIFIIIAWLIVALVLYFFVLGYRGEVGSCLTMAYIGSTCCLCWIGFPIGWRWCKGEAGLPFSFIVGILTMALSVPIAIFQIFFSQD